MRAMWSNPWSADKFNFKSDVNDFKVIMNDQEREMVTRCLSAIAQIEVAVKTFWSKLGENLPHPSIADLGAVMASIEVIHNVAYERLLDELDLHEVFENNLKLDIIADRVKYLRKHTHRYYKDSKKQYVYALILFTLYVENVSLFSQFYTICYFNRFRNMLKDTTQQVAYTSKEEAIHAKCGMRIINDLRVEYPELFDAEMIEKIRYEAGEAYKAEAKIIDWQLNEYTDEGRISPAIVKNFIKNRLNESLEMISVEPIFDDIDEDLLRSCEWFEEDVLGETKTDFFHARPTEYSKNNRTFSEDDLF
jgi:ribonucleoside-diphosphate reductase beta chain